MLARPTTIIRSRTHFTEKLGCQNNLLALPFQPAADILFRAADGLRRMAQGVDIGSVKEGHAVVEGFIHNGVRGGFITLVAEGHRPQANFGYFQAGAS